MDEHLLYPANPGYVIGFHGTDERTAKAIVERGESFRPSVGAAEWLGKGVYFWQNDPVRAEEWARKMSKGKPAVVGAVIDLGFCLHLMERRWMTFVKEAHDSYLKMMDATGGKPERNEDNSRRLDCAVIQVAHQRAKERYGRLFDSVIGPFSQGGTLYETSMLCTLDHMQICVVNQNCIKGCFYPRMMDPQGAAC